MTDEGSWWASWREAMGLDFQSLWNCIKNWIRFLISLDFTHAAQWWGFTVTATGEVAWRIQRACEHVVERVEDAVDGIATGIENWVTEKYAWLDQYVVDTWDRFVGIWGWIGTKGEGAWGWVRDKGSIVWDWIQTHSDEIATWFETQFDRITDWFVTKSDAIATWFEDQAVIIGEWFRTSPSVPGGPRSRRSSRSSPPIA